MSRDSSRGKILRILSWNVNGLSRSGQKVEFIQSLNPDIALLIEVTPKFHGALQEQGYFQHIAFSLDHCFGTDIRKRPLGCVIAAREAFLEKAELLPGMPVAERALLARAKLGKLGIDLCAFHAPPGVNWGSAKSDAYEALSKWLENRGGLAILGMDGNSPKVDHPNPAESVFWRAKEDSVLGVNARHRLGDVFRSFLASNPAMRENLARERPNGPLAVSYDRGRGASIPCRYDFILASPAFIVRHVEYPLEQSLQAGSDHSAVLAELEVQEG